MIKEIQYKGYATEPSDYECADGQLATSLNLISEDNQLKPLFQPKELCDMPDGFKVVYIHTSNTFTHYIVINNDKYYWFDKSIIDKGNYPITISESDLKKLDLQSITLYQITSVGNTLVFLTTDGLQYFLWRDGAYSYLGNHIPELPLSFGLQGTRKESEAFDVTYNESVSYNDSILSAEYSDALKDNVTNQVLAKVNKFIADNYTNGHQFLYPFFVRYAYRLYDGTLTMHSAPILMVCATGQAPYVLGGHSTQTDKGWDGTWDSQKITGCKVYGGLYSLDFAVVAEKYITELKKWSDIVTSVDIFISAPLYSYDQSGKCSGIDKISNGKIGGRAEYCVCKATHGGNYNTYYQYHSMVTFLMYGKSSLPGWSIKLPLKKSSVQKENIKNASQFYFLKSYKLDNLTTARRIVDIEDGYLQSLETREVMTDDYDSHTTIIAKNSFSYNSRLNLSGITRVMPNGFHMSSLLCYTNGFLQPKNGLFSNGVDNTYVDKQQISMFIYIKKQEKTIVVRSLDYLSTFLGDFSETEVGQFTPTPFLYYPDTDAYKAVLFWHMWKSDGTLGGTGEMRVFREISLEPHPMLNGAIYYNGWEEVSGNDVSEGNVNKGSDNVTQRSVSVPNKIYTSEVNNPFHFPVLGINTVGTGNIIGISAAAKALSQGQFGQFPLYAFTSDGVWALEVSSTGTYSAKQPITRDVCINYDSITQLDDAVLFATDRGIMLIQGSQTRCITDTIFSEAPFNVLELPCIEQLHTKLGHDADACLPVKPFLGFLSGCRMVYDYVHQHIIVFNPTKENGVPLYTYAYVYSLKSQMWGMVASCLLAPINAYPDALAMTHDNKLVSFNDTDDDICKGLFITRPLKLEAADVHKTIFALIQRGHFQRGDVGTVLYGSRDLYTWRLIWSSKDHILRGFRGTPYKYFRIAGLVSFSDGKSIFGASVNFEPRHMNNLR